MPSQAKRQGITLGTALCLIFVVLKLTGLITWSWLWVLSPLWIPWALIIVIVLFVLVVTRR